MNWLPVRVVELSELRLPSDWRDRLASARAAEFAAVLKNTAGPIHLPVVEASTGEIVAGVDRIAALVTGGEKRFECRIWTGSPAEKRMIRASENAHRRPDQDKPWAIEYREAIEERRKEAGELLGAAPMKSRGRKKTPAAAAREEAAKELGTTPQALRRRERREAEAAAESESPQPAAPAPRPARIETRIAHARQELDDVKAALQGFLGELRTNKVHEPARFVDRAIVRIVECWEALGSAIDAIERGRRALRDADRPIDAVKASQNPAMRRPQVGLGGRRLNVINAETGQPFVFDDDGAPDTEVEP